MRTPSVWVFSLIVCLAAARPGWAAETQNFRPDPASVQRYGPAYRYPQAGWIVLHIEGKPYERGYQHGRLLAPEIAAYVRCFAAQQGPRAPAEAWRHTRTLADSLFLRRFDKEYLEEMRGIADGAAAAGARFEGRALDLTDIACLNLWAEIETLEPALYATPVGLEGTRFTRPRPASADCCAEHCSAFAATGPATADGKIVFGHITMFALYPGSFANVWLDVRPAQGHRVVMQTVPGGIQSGMDYYLNDAGIMLSETTIAQTRFDAAGAPVASRVRKAIQYAETIDQVVDFLKAANNGLYTNEWLIGDAKTNEIALFELGTRASRLLRSSRGEWYGGTEGFYWGCNNTKEVDVRAETVPALSDRPADLVWEPSRRDKAWLRFYATHKGKITLADGMRAFTSAPLASASSLDAKVTTTDLAKTLRTHALFGPPLGRTWLPTDAEKKNFPEVAPLVNNPWTVLHAQVPSADGAEQVRAVDLLEKAEIPTPARNHGRHDVDPSGPAWFGTLLPRTDADIWLASGFAAYERFVELEDGLRRSHDDGALGREDRERLAVERYRQRAELLAWPKESKAVPGPFDLDRDRWVRAERARGFLLLDALRQELGAKAFGEMMETFGRQQAGREVTGRQFREHVEQATHRDWSAFFTRWEGTPELPSFQFQRVAASPSPGEPSWKFAVVDRKSAAVVAGKTVEVTVETASGEKTLAVKVDPDGTVEVPEEKQATRVVLNKYMPTLTAQGGRFTVLSFVPELEEALIVYGTADDEAANRSAAEAFQEAIRLRWNNIVVPVRADREVGDNELGRHLLLVGGPGANRLTARFRETLPVRFGTGSFTVGNETYAHSGSAVIAATTNPLAPTRSVVVIAGLSATATYHAPTFLLRRDDGAGEVLLLPHRGKARSVAVPPEGLVVRIGKGSAAGR